MKHLPVAVLVLFVISFARAAAPSGTLAHFAFDEGGGSFADDDSGAELAASLTPSARWAHGSFGTALATGERGACAQLDVLPALTNADACTIAIRFRKENAGFGKCPCLLATSAWGPGKGRGGILFFSEGRLLRLRLRSSGGQETSLNVFAEMPEKKWTSVVLTFERPNVKAYADGRLVSSVTWDHPIAVAGHLVLGGWNGDSFGGFLDDLYVASNAWDANRIKSYATAGGYEEIEGYQDDGTGGVRKTELLGQEGRPFATFKDADASLTFGDRGEILSLKESVSGRELVAKAVPFLTVGMTDGKTLVPRRLMRRGENCLVFVFPGGRGEAVVRVTPFDGGWTFLLESLDVVRRADAAKDAPLVKDVKFGQICPACNKWSGHFVNAISDERSVVCVRSYGLIGEPHVSGSEAFVRVQAPFTAQGLAIGLAAGPREGFRRQLRGMTLAAGVPRSDCGGAWSMGAEQSRRSYVFADVRRGDIDDWIDFVKRAGFSIIHLSSSWCDCLGPYTVNPRAFPEGLDGMKAAAAKVHAAGLQIGLHSLTACINPRASWITPVCDSNLVADATYTLAAPLAPDADEIVVNEMPIPRHSTVFTYSSNGNVMRLGGELIQYSAIRRAKPYAFTGLKRGAFGTRRTERTVPAGERIDYLHQRYIAFYPAPDSALADRLADRLGEIYNTCNLDEFYFDGSEGMGTRYGIDTMRHKIYSRFQANNGHSPSIEASCPNANNWWFQTRMATTDHGVWGMKRFHDWHLGWGVDIGRVRNFLEPQMGWWQPRLDVPRARGHFPDEMEYFASKNAGHDAAMSLQGVSARPLPVGIRRQLTILGWYEHARLARCFTPEAQAWMAAPQTESRLRQDGDGVWQLTKVESHVHRAGHDWERAWRITNAWESPAAVRVEALYRAGEEKGGKCLLGRDDFAAMKSQAAKGVTAEIKTGVASAGHGPAFRLTAKNAEAARTEAWAVAKKAFDFPGRDLGEEKIAFAVWVKGDGSGAILNLQLTTPGEFVGGISEHYVRLDFTGWKRVSFLLRERDAARYSQYKWPYGAGYAAIYRNFVNPRHVASFAVWLNDIPVGGQASVEIGEVTAVDQVSAPLEKATVVVGGQSVEVPFALKSGEYAELEADGWTHYSALAEKLAVAPAVPLPTLKAGPNDVAVKLADDARAEVTLFALGETIPAYADDLTLAARRELRYEGMMPFEYAPERGFLAPTEIPVRPGEAATLSLEVRGVCEKPTFVFRSFFGMFKTECVFDTAIAEGEKLVCRDGATWQVVGEKDGKVVREGRLAEPLPVLGKTTAFSFSAKRANNAVCTVDILKQYPSR